MAGRPKKNEKEKLVSVGLSISPEQEKELKEIAEKEDREMGYIKRVFYLRGLALYRLDGVLRDPLNSFIIRITPQQNPNIREEFRASAHLRGVSMAYILHNHITQIVEEDKKNRPEEFAEALKFVRQVGPDEEGNKVYASAVMRGSSSATVDLTVGKPEPTTGSEAMKEIQKPSRKTGRDFGVAGANLEEKKPAKKRGAK